MRLVTSVLSVVTTTLLVMGRTSKAVNSAKNIAAIRDQIVKDMGMDHIPDVKHVSIFNISGHIVANFLVLQILLAPSKGALYLTPPGYHPIPSDPTLSAT